MPPPTPNISLEDLKQGSLLLLAKRLTSCGACVFYFPEKGLCKHDTPNKYNSKEADVCGQFLDLELAKRLKPV